MSPRYGRLRRSFPKGDRIHAAGCRYATSTNSVPWAWAEDKSDDEWIGKAWLKPCRVCLPELAKRQDELRARSRIVIEEIAE